MAVITITYTPVKEFATGATQQIFSQFTPSATASDNAKFAGTYYQTNVWDNGEFPYATTLKEFLDSQVAHPGLIAALRAAVRAYDEAEGKGVYEWNTTEDDVLYIEELGPALKGEGFEFAVGSGS